MSLRVTYESGLSSEFTDISDRFREYAFDVAQDAEEGSVAVSSVTIDDPDGDYDIKGWRRFRFYENAAAGSNTLIANLWITDRQVIRGPYKTGAGRQWVCQVADMNSVLGFRVFTESNANRPAETDVQRIQWMQSQLGTPGVPETEYVDTSGPVNMDAVDYRGQTRLSVIDDCAQASGKNYFVYTKDNGPSVVSSLGLWYAHTASTMYSSPLRLSNVNVDIESDPYGNTFAIAEDSELKRDPSRVYSGGYGQFDGGQVFEEDLTISNEFTRRDAIVPMENVKTAAKATARVLRYLDDYRTESDRISTAVILPAAKVNFVREGMRVQFKATHFPGYEGFEYLRVLQRKVKFNSEDPNNAYLVSLELASEGPEPLPADDPDLEYAICNSESGGVITDRSANGPDDTFDVAGTWYWELTNPQHDEAAYTEFLKLHYDNPGQVVIDLVAAMGGTGGPAGASNLQHPADPGHCPYDVLPAASGTFTVPSGALGFQFQAKSQGYSAPCSAPYVAECWTLKLWRI